MPSISLPELLLLVFILLLSSETVTDAIAFLFNGADEHGTGAKYVSKHPSTNQVGSRQLTPLRRAATAEQSITT